MSSRHLWLGVAGLLVKLSASLPVALVPPGAAPTQLDAPGEIRTAVSLDDDPADREIRGGTPWAA